AAILEGDFAPPLLVPIPGGERDSSTLGLETGGGVRAPVVGDFGPSRSAWSAGSDRNAVSLLCMPLSAWADLTSADAIPDRPADDPLQQDGEGWLWDEFLTPPVQPGRIEK